MICKAACHTARNALFARILSNAGFEIVTAKTDLGNLEFFPCLR